MRIGEEPPSQDPLESRREGEGEYEGLEETEEAHEEDTAKKQGENNKGCGSLGVVRSGQDDDDARSDEEGLTGEGTPW